MRILGLDYGDKTIGVAVSDPFGWTAQGVEIIRRDTPVEYKKSLRRLAELGGFCRRTEMKQYEQFT